MGHGHLPHVYFIPAEQKKNNNKKQHHNIWTETHVVSRRRPLRDQTVPSVAGTVWLLSAVTTLAIGEPSDSERLPIKCQPIYL